MNLDDAIKHCEEIAESKEKQVKNGDWKKDSLTERNCIKSAEEHRQLAEWLKDYKRLKEQEPKWIPVSERLPEEDGDYYVTYEKGYAEDYDLPPKGIAGFEVDCECFGYWYEHFDRQTLGSLGSEWEEIKVIAWMPLPPRYQGE